MLPIVYRGSMARHTADYGEKHGFCFNDVGVWDWDEDEAYEGVEAVVGMEVF